MARGWESKSVEEQQAEKADRNAPQHPPVSAAQQKLDRKRDGLLLSRKNLVRQLEATSNARHRRMLEEAVAEIDRQLACFEQNTDSSRT